MPEINVRDFVGLIPRIDDHLLPENAATVADNVFLLSGALTSYKDRLYVKDLVNTGSQSIYYYRYGNSPDWIEWDDSGVNVVESPIINEVFDRIYYTGASHFQSWGREADAAQKAKVFANWDTAGGSHPDGSSTGDVILGCPAPTKAVTVEVNQRSLDLKWTRIWRSYWEDTGDNAKYEVQDLEEGTDIIEVEKGKEYSITDTGILTAPSVTPVGDLVFMVQLQAFSNDTESGSVGENLGVAYPENSFYQTDNTLNIDNSDVLISLTYDPDIETSPLTEVTVNLSYTIEQGLRDRYSLDRSYVYTFVNLFGEESGPSQPSTLTVVDPTQKADLTGVGGHTVGVSYEVGDIIEISGTPYECNTDHVATVTPNLSYWDEIRTQITSKRIYRSVFTEAGTDFRLVAEINIGNNDYEDLVEDKDTTDLLPSTFWSLPPDGIQSLTSLGSFFAAFKDNTVYFSEVNRPHAWNLNNAITLDANIVGLSAIANTLVAMTDEGPVIMQAYTPSSISQVPSNYRQALTNREAVVSAEGVLYYASPDGIVQFNPGGGAEVITENYFLKKQWQTYNPDTMKFEIHDRRLYILTDSGTDNLIFDLDERQSAFVTFDNGWDIAGARYNDWEDILYFIIDDKIYKWNESSDNLSYVWRSKKFRFDQPTHFNSARIYAEDYTEELVLKLYAKDVLMLTVDIVAQGFNDDIFRLPKSAKAKTWSFQIESNVPVYDIMVASSANLIRGA